MQLSQREKDEKAAIRQQVQQEVARAWPSADQEKEQQSVKFRMGQKTVALEKGALADPKAFAKEMAMGRFQQPRQEEA